VAEETNEAQITIEYDQVVAPSGTTYELQIGTMHLNDFVTIDETTRTVSEAGPIIITRGSYYAFRYRAVFHDCISDWSPIAKIQAATKPRSLYPNHSLVSTTLNSVTISFDKAFDNAGSSITGYKLYRDDGNLANPIDIQVVGYTGEDQYEINGLTPNLKYRF
jgi:hypothetical protein